ncbi:hypothetical protein EJ05DRAFT_355579 [Pseudovirgaria hyperparasitica]|uniref:Swi5-domain-containing protein n=1 Tax=Pseudovirgaria hyperparasitica TaxID=470096 RepID=A0A6A6W7N8_9PEZI|nr:uncharacterized protein EJ05DRAFT_355579 [Pseudovirgaria hyperparasitica]KAF2758555.1 hypothetical protein EJ05DRAFT_355579 [Pseudovirgaria hyperparasitica]
MSTPLPKRRRLNGPSALHKPFKSPFRTALATCSNPPDTPPSSDNIEPKSDQPDEPSTTTSEPRAQPTVSTPFRNPYQPSTPSTTKSRPHPPPFRTPQSIARPNAPQQSLRPQPQTSHVSTPTSTSLSLRTSHLRTQIHTLNQAIQLLSNPDSDTHLLDLTSKWRSASRLAAEELFASSRERVQRMGGVSAWKDKEREGRTRMLTWEEERLDEENGLESSDSEASDDEDGANDDDGDDEGENKRLSPEERDMRREARREARTIARERLSAMKAQIRERRRAEDYAASMEVNSDESFTLDMMLRALNVDLDVIGYSKAVQGWVG